MSKSQLKNSKLDKSLTKNIEIKEIVDTQWWVIYICPNYS